MGGVTDMPLIAWLVLAATVTFAVYILVFEGR